MRRSWWKVPLYCTLASWICFQLEVRLGARFLVSVSPDGTASMNETGWILLSVLLFLAVVCIGGLLFFRRMTRREVLCSATVLAALNVVFGLLAYNLLSVLLFLAVVCIGGLLFFRRMTRREVLCSATVLAALNVVFGLLAYKMQGMFAIYVSEFTSWDSIFSDLLYRVMQNPWVTAIVNWILPPYIFVLFGQKEVHTD